MALLGNAAMILSFDIVPEGVVEHDNWHSLEHLHERMSIPGFRRGSRGTVVSGGARYFVMYTVADLDTLASPPYLERLNNPSPWTARIMKHYRGMNRGFCRVTFSSGFGLGNCGLFHYLLDVLLQFVRREVLVPVIHGLELTAINSHHGMTE